ncbi:hypothetical protein Hanom_Chr16g01415371 [Helianthus anomalus]
MTICYYGYQHQTTCQRRELYYHKYQHDGRFSYGLFCQVSLFLFLLHASGDHFLFCLRFFSNLFCRQIHQNAKPPSN